MVVSENEKVVIFKYRLERAVRHASALLEGIVNNPLGDHTELRENLDSVYQDVVRAAAECDL